MVVPIRSNAAPPTLCPWTLSQALTEAELTSADALMIGDSLSDIQAAHVLAISCVGLANNQERPAAPHRGRRRDCHGHASSLYAAAPQLASPILMQGGKAVPTATRIGSAPCRQSPASRARVRLSVRRPTFYTWQRSSRGCTSVPTATSPIPAPARSRSTTMTARGPTGVFSYVLGDTYGPARVCRPSSSRRSWPREFGYGRPVHSLGFRLRRPARSPDFRSL